MSNVAQALMPTLLFHETRPPQARVHMSVDTAGTSACATFRMSYFVLVIGFFIASSANAQQDWRVYGGNSASTRYSSLAQIHRENVNKLAVAWTYDTGDAFAKSEMQCNPIVVNGVLYATTPKLRLIALNAATGKLRWQYDPNSADKAIGKSRNRGCFRRSLGSAADHRGCAFPARP